MSLSCITRIKLLVTIIGGVCLFTLTSPAQVTDIFFEKVKAHESTVGNADLAGLITYRLWATTTRENDVIGSVFGDKEHPLEITTTTSFWQADVGGNFGSDIACMTFAANRELEFDTYLTIGIACNSGWLKISALEDKGSPWLEKFSSGQSILINSAVGGGWVIPPDRRAAGGPEKKVLLGQFTTSGIISVNLNMSYTENYQQSGPSQKMKTANFKLTTAE